MATLKERVVRAIESSAAAYGASVDIRVVKEMPAAIIDAEATAIISQAICETFGEAGLTTAKSTPGSEDFFHYLRLRPAVKGGFWGLGCNLLPGLHHPEMHFDRTALADGVRVFKSCVRQLLG